MTARAHLRLVVADRPPSYQVTATPGWPPVRIPGEPGRWRHCIDGEQIDLPHNNTTEERSDS